MADSLSLAPVGGSGWKEGQTAWRPGWTTNQRCGQSPFLRRVRGTGHTFQKAVAVNMEVSQPAWKATALGHRKSDRPPMGCEPLSPDEEPRKGAESCLGRGPCFTGRGPPHNTGLELYCLAVLEAGGLKSRSSWVWWGFFFF